MTTTNLAQKGLLELATELKRLIEEARIGSHRRTSATRGPSFSRLSVPSAADIYDTRNFRSLPRAGYVSSR
jgi:hypothetical protein